MLYELLKLLISLDLSDEIIDEVMDKAILKMYKIDVNINKRS